MRFAVLQSAGNVGVTGGENEATFQAEFLRQQVHQIVVETAGGAGLIDGVCAGARTRQNDEFVGLVQRLMDGFAATGNKYGKNKGDEAHLDVDLC